MKTFARSRKPKRLTRYGTRWTVRRVIGENYREEVKEVLKRDWNADAGTKLFLEKYQQGLTTVVGNRSAQELEAAELLATDWNTGLFPDRIRARLVISFSAMHLYTQALQKWG